MFKDTYWKESSLTLSPKQCFNHRKTWMKQLVNKLTIRYYFLTAVLNRNIIISLSAWNSKSGSGSKLPKIYKIKSRSHVFFPLYLFVLLFFFHHYGYTSQVVFFLSLFSFLFPFQLQSFLQVNVTQVHVDECVDADCRGGGGCTSHLSVTDKPAVVDSGSMALVSVTVEATAVCSCSAREHLHQSCSVYPRNPCHNGGVCVDTQSGYRWESTGFPLKAFLKDFISLHIWGESERDSSEMFTTCFL